MDLIKSGSANGDEAIRGYWLRRIDLLAAAPELLAALEDTLRMLEAARRETGSWDAANPRVVKARGALAKAKKD